MSRVTFTQQDQIGIIKMDDGKANAIQGAFLNDFEGAVEAAEDPQIKAVVITGRKGLFSAGLDVRTLPTLEEPERVRVGVRFGQLAARLFKLPKPMVSAIDGHAIAGGMVLAMCADRRVGADNVKYGMTEVPVGLAMPTVVVEMMRLLLPAHVLQEAVLEGRTYTADEALRAGLLNSVHPIDDVFDAAMADAQRLAKLDTEAYATTKRRMRPALPEHTLEPDFIELARAMPRMAK